ncbi:MAG TPA: alkaline phosphatase family protein, partial [Acidimicrobiales bacterium]|nr:alkaline phosphatase family protein [Acidimicrobiales bacterium]
MSRTLSITLGAIVLVITAAACGNSNSNGGTGASASSTVAPANGSAAIPPAPSQAHTPNPHIMVIMMENKSYSQVIGQADQPYTNLLARTYGLVTNSYSFGHPSLPNYLDIISGSNQNVTDDNVPSAHNFPGVTTVGDQLALAGFSEKAYAENLPSDPTNNSGNYAVRHFPWEYFPSTKMPIANSTSMVGDLNSATPPDFVWFTPNVIDDEHNGTAAQGDYFLSEFIPQVQATSWYTNGGAIIITWDEADSDNTDVHGGQNGGGHVPTIVISNPLHSNPHKYTTPVATAGILRS